MKNELAKKVKKCVVFSPKTLEKIIKEETDENVHIVCILGEPFFDTQYSNNHGNRYFTNILNKHFDVKIKSMHCVGDTSDFKVWMEIA